MADLDTLLQRSHDLLQRAENLLHRAAALQADESKQVEADMTYVSVSRERHQVAEQIKACQRQRQT